MADDIVEIELEGVAMRLATHPRVWSPTSFARSFAEHLVPRVGPGVHALELGLGSGVLSILAGRKGAEISGLDINADAVRMTEQNWASHDLPPKPERFRLSDRFDALRPSERFDLIWSNPPVLPALDDQPPTGTRDDFEVSGPDGRLVLDAMLQRAGRHLNPGGSILTIATSLQGQGRTEELLQAGWGSHRTLAHLELALTDECGPAYVDWWQRQTAQDGQRRVFQRDGDPTWWHDVWIIAASDPR